VSTSSRDTYWDRFWSADLKGFSLQGVQHHTVSAFGTTTMCAGMAVPLAQDFLIAYVTLDFIGRFLSLEKAFQDGLRFQASTTSRMLKASKWMRWRGYAVLLFFGGLVLYRLCIALIKFSKSGSASPCNTYFTPCEYYFDVVMQFPVRAALPLVAFFHFHAFEIQLGVFKLMHTRLQHIHTEFETEQDESPKHEPVPASRKHSDHVHKHVSNHILAEDSEHPLTQPESSTLDGLDNSIHSIVYGLFMVLVLVYTSWIFALQIGTSHIRYLGLRDLSIIMRVLILSIVSGMLAMQVNWALWLLSRTIASHTKFVKATLGDDDDDVVTHSSEELGGREHFINKKVPNSLADLPRLDIAEESEMRLFFKLWMLLNVREQEATLLMDHVVSTCFVVVLVNVFSYSTMLFFSFISATSHQSVFMLGSSIFSVQTQALLNLLIWGYAITNAVSCCHTYSVAIKKDERYFKDRTTSLWLAPVSSKWYAKDKGLGEDKTKKALMIEQLMKDIASKGHSIRFLGQPIDQAMVGRLMWYKVTIGLALFSTWCLRVWNTQS